MQDTTKFAYTDTGSGQPILLLHGLFGEMYNWTFVQQHFGNRYRILIPDLSFPAYAEDQADEPQGRGVDHLLYYLEGFVEWMGLDNLIIIGNSLGGHIALLYCCRHPEKVAALILTGSSGLFEQPFGGSYPRRGNYAYIKERVEATFFNPAIATPQMIDEVYAITNNSRKCLAIIRMAKSAQRNNLAASLPALQVRTLLVWGRNDTIAPPEVAVQFHQLIAGSELYWIDQCGHAAMMEQPELFNARVELFLAHT